MGFDKCFPCVVEVYVHWIDRHCVVYSFVSPLPCIIMLVAFCLHFINLLAICKTKLVFYRVMQGIWKESVSNNIISRSAACVYGHFASDRTGDIVSRCKDHRKWADVFMIKKCVLLRPISASVCGERAKNKLLSMLKRSKIKIKIICTTCAQNTAFYL